LKIYDVQFNKWVGNFMSKFYGVSSGVDVCCCGLQRELSQAK